jgi:hypothetical protein
MTTSSTRDPRRDCQEIARHLATVVFPWDTTRALELALFRTFASARIGGLLHGTGEFEARTGKRYDDTDLIISEIIENGFDSPRGARAIARMNALHGRFRIANEDFLYVLSTFVLRADPLEPALWLAAHDRVEKLAWFWFWRQVGERMLIRDLPDSHADFERFSGAYEAANFRFTTASQGVALATRELFAGWFPGPCARSSAAAFTPCSIRRCSRRSTCGRRRAGWCGPPSVPCARGHGRFAGCHNVGARSCARRSRVPTIRRDTASNRSDHRRLVPGTRLAPRMMTFVPRLPWAEAMHPTGWVMRIMKMGHRSRRAPLQIAD